MNTLRFPTLLALLISLLATSGCAVEAEPATSVGHLADALGAPGAFELFQAADDEWYFNLKAGNGHVVLRSEGYVSKQGAENGIDAVERHAIDMAFFELREAANGEWYFVLEAGNHEVIGVSELYSSKWNAKRGAETVNAVVTKMLRASAAATFNVFAGHDGKFYFNLEAGNHEIVLQSQGYTAKSSAFHGIESVRNNGSDIDNFVIEEAANGEWYFVLVAQNGEVIGFGETYPTKWGALGGAKTVRGLLYSQRVADAE